MSYYERKIKQMLLPEITSLSQLFDGFKYVQDREADRHNYYWIGSPLNQHRGIRRADNVSGCSYKGWWCLYGDLKENIRKEILPCVIGYVSGFKLHLVEGRGWLLTVNGTEWLTDTPICLLPLDYDLMQHLSPGEREFIEKDNKEEETIKEEISKLRKAVTLGNYIREARAIVGNDEKLFSCLNSLIMDFMYDRQVNKIADEIKEHG